MLGDRLQPIAIEPVLFLVVLDFFMILLAFGVD